MRDDHFLIVAEVVVTVAVIWLVAYITRRATAATGARLAPVLAALVPLVGGIAAVIAALHG